MTTREAILGGLLVAAASLAGCSRSAPPPEARGEKLKVAATIFPIADMLRQVGGPYVEVACLLPPGASPHGFSATPRDAEELARSKLLFLVGMGLDEWARQAAQTARAAGLTVVELTKEQAFRKAYDLLDQAQPAPPAQTQPPSEPAAEADQDHQHESGDPHVWLDPVFMQAFTQIAVDELVRADPNHAEAYRSAGQGYLQALRRLDEEYRTELAGLAHRSFVTYHAAFTYVARRYGLRQAAMDPSGSGAMSPARLERVLQFLRDHQVKAIFVEPQFPPDRMKALADQTGVRIHRLDPLGNPNLAGYDSYLAMMTSNLRELTTALKE